MKFKIVGDIIRVITRGEGEKERGRKGGEGGGRKEGDTFFFKPFTVDCEDSSTK